MVADMEGGESDEERCVARIRMRRCLVTRSVCGMVWRSRSVAGAVFRLCGESIDAYIVKDLCVLLTYFDRSKTWVSVHYSSLSFLGYCHVKIHSPDGLVREQDAGNVTSVSFAHLFMLLLNVQC